MNALLVLASLITSIVYLVYYVSKKKYNYWKNKNVPYIKPLPILGNYGDYILQKQIQGVSLQHLCLKFSTQPYFGIFFGTEPVLVVQNPDIIKDVLTKDFYYFNGREITNYAHKEIITRNLFFSGGEKWKVVRQNLTPLFSSSKMKNMFHLIEKCGHYFESMLAEELEMSDVIETRDICARYTMDSICSCAFGVDANAMGKNPDNPFRFMADELFLPTTYRGFKIVFRAIWPAVFYGLGFKHFPPTLNDFFSKLLKGVFDSRENKPSARHDFVDLVLSLRNQNSLIGDCLSNLKTGKNDKFQLKVDDDLLVSLCIMFFAAGFETSASTISFTIFEFAKNPEIQRKAMEEVDEFLRRHKNKLNYECVNELPYLKACIYETLRRYPVIGVLTREVMDTYQFSTGLRVDKGVRVHIPVYHMHHNPDYFPEPEKYKPERFLPENKNDLKPYTYFPFGEGPRICIGNYHLFNVSRI